MRKQILSGLVILFFCLGLTKTYAQKWQPGYYYDNAGNKIEGFLSGYLHTTNIFHPDNDYFLFSKVADTGYNETKSVKVFAKDASALVIGIDSFVVLKTKELNNTSFLNVMVNNKVKLYATEIIRNVPVTGLMFVAAMATGKSKYIDASYYYGPDPGNLTELRKKNFEQGMSQVLADRPDVVKLIQDKTFTYDNFDKLLTFLKTGQVSTDDDSTTQ